MKAGRNDPCPCGSGKKYKKCHGQGGPKKFVATVIQSGGESLFGRISSTAKGIASGEIKGVSLKDRVSRKLDEVPYQMPSAAEENRSSHDEKPENFTM